MGCDITILHKHNLDLSSIEKLAIDLHNRLNISIEYGYHASQEYNALLGNNLEEGFISLGYLKSEPFIQKYTLIDERFQQKQLHEKFGDALYEMREYWIYWDNMPEKKIVEQEKIDNKIAEYDLNGSDSQLSIFDNIISNRWVYYSGWWHFCNTIQNKYIFDEEYYQKFRKKIMKVTQQLGGNKAYFVNDQCEHLKGVGGGDEIYYSWNELENYINSRETLEVVSISNVVLDSNYQYEVINKKQDKLAFVDDFEDIDNLEKNDFRDELTEKMHTEFTISEEKELEIKIKFALENMKDFSYSFERIFELYGITESQIEDYKKRNKKL